MRKSVFDGGVGGMIGKTILYVLLTMISLGFAWPAAHCMFLRWMYSHTVIEGKRLKFTGGGGSLFKKYIVWALLSIVTLGIYSLWVPVKYKRWETEHVEFEEKDVVEEY